MHLRDQNAERHAALERPARLSKEAIQSLGTPDFLHWIGKRHINPGGVNGRKKVLDALRIQPGSRVLEIGSGNGHAACMIARQYGCKVAAVDLSPAKVHEAGKLARSLGVDKDVIFLQGDAHELDFPDGSFDHVVCESVLVHTRHDVSIPEIRRVLKEGGSFAGQELCWRRLPHEALREKTASVCGDGQFDIHTKYGWIGQLRQAGFDEAEAEEYPFEMFHARQFLRDEGWLQSLSIFMGMLFNGAMRKKMTDIRSHFFSNAPYFNYLVFSAIKKQATVSQMPESMVKNAA